MHVQDNYLNRDEMLAALQEVGVFNGIRAKHVGKELIARFSWHAHVLHVTVSLHEFTYQRAVEMKSLV
jgi:hypothetical protein